VEGRLRTEYLVYSFLISYGMIVKNANIFIFIFIFVFVFDSK
jgi:hypothetical protein